jgi:hypothetical protein
MVPIPPHLTADVLHAKRRTNAGSQLDTRFLYAPPAADLPDPRAKFPDSKA